MTTEMFSYFERVVVWLTTGKLRARVEADSGTSAFVQLIDADGKEDKTRQLLLLDLTKRTDETPGAYNVTHGDEEKETEAT